MHEDLTVRAIVLILLWAPDVKVNLLRGRIDLPGGGFLVRHRVVHFQGLPIANALRHHEMHFVILIQGSAV